MTSIRRLPYTKSLQVLYQTGSNILQPISSSKPLTVGLSILFPFLTSGIIYGFPALSDILIVNEKAFSTMCDVGEELPCRAQENYIALTITIAVAAVSFTAFPVGIFLDYFGPRTTVCASSVIFASGLASLAFASAFSDLLYIYGFFALAVGGPSLLTSMVNFAELFSSHAPAIISVQSGAFQLSSILMVFFRVLISHHGFTFRQVFLSYLVVPGVIFVTSLLLFPRKAYGTEEGPGHHGEPHRTWLIRRILVARQETAREENQKIKSKSDLESPLLDNTASFISPTILAVPKLAPEDAVPRPPELFNVDFKRQAMSQPFFVVAVILSFYILNLNFHLATEKDQLLQEAFAAGKDKQAAEKTVSDYISSFSIFLPIGGMASVPIVALVLVRNGVAPSFAFIGVLNFIFLTTSIPNFLPMELKRVGYAALSTSRPFMYSTITTYIAEVFGYSNFGKLFGLVQLGGLLVGPIQYALIISVHQFLKDDYFWINISLLLVGGFLFIAFIYYLVHSLFSGFFQRPPLPSRQENDLDTEYSML